MGDIYVNDADEGESAWDDVNDVEEGEPARKMDRVHSGRDLMMY